MEENVTMNSCGKRPVDAQNVSWSLKIKATCYVSHKKDIKTIRLPSLHKEQGMCVGLLVPSTKLQSVSYNIEVMLP